MRPHGFYTEYYTFNTFIVKVLEDQVVPDQLLYEIFRAKRVMLERLDKELPRVNKTDQTCWLSGVKM